MGDLIWSKGLLRKGPGIFHVVAGNGYVFHLTYRLTTEDIYLHSAILIFKCMGSGQFKEARTPDYSYRLYKGLVGPACHLVDTTSLLQAICPSCYIVCGTAYRINNCKLQELCRNEKNLNLKE